SSCRTSAFRGALRSLLGHAGPVSVAGIRAAYSRRDRRRGAPAALPRARRVPRADLAARAALRRGAAGRSATAAMALGEPGPHLPRRLAGLLPGGGAARARRLPHLDGGDAAPGGGAAGDGGSGPLRPGGFRAPRGAHRDVVRRRRAAPGGRALAG